MPRVLVVGATGPCGVLLVRECIAREGYHVVIYARNPTKLPDDIKVHEKVTVVEGTLEDEEALGRAMENVEAVLSALGPRVTAGPFHSPNSPLAQGYKRLIAVMQRAHCRRLIALGTASIKDKEHDKFSATFLALVTGVATLAYTAYFDVVQLGKVIMESTDIDWTIARVPVLTDKQSTEYVAGYVGDGKTNAWLSRAGFARFVLEELEGGAWKNRLPLVSST